MSWQATHEGLVLMSKVRDLTGEKFGFLTALRPDGSQNGSIVWLCLCDCGSHHHVARYNLITGGTKSCGCQKYKNMHNKVHGHSYPPTRTYESWAAMIQRCTNPKHVDWHRYGGRGIKVCKRWMTFANFLADMGERGDGLTLDRIDPDGDYKPSNCRWASWKEQRINQRRMK